MPISKQDYERLLRFRSTLRRFIRFADEGARDAGITPQQHQFLLAIKGQEGRDWATLSEVAEALQLKHHATVGLADRCQASGLIERHTRPEDRRRVAVTLTRKGESLLEELSVRNLEELRALSSLIRLEELAESAIPPPAAR